MSFYVVVCLALLRVYYTDAVTQFHYTVCSPPGAPISISNIQLSPDPITLPGDMVITFDGSNNSTISDASLKLNVSKDGFHVPCILSELGSCTYTDLCHLLPKMEKENWFGVMGGIATQIKAALTAGGVIPTCPFTPGSLHVSGQTFHLPHIPSLLTMFATGDYHFEVTIKDNPTQAVLFCLRGDIHVQKQGGGFFLG